MGAKELIEKGTTETKTNKSEIIDAEITMKTPPKGKFEREPGLPSPFDAMYMEPIIDIKNASEVFTVTGEISGNKDVYQKRKKLLNIE